MISLWTPNRKASASLRKLFRLNLFEVSAPKDNQLKDILEVMTPINDAPDRMSVFGISTHLSETLRPLIKSHKTLSPSGEIPNPSNAPMEYESVRSWLSKRPVEDRLIATPEFMKSHHGLLCLGGMTLAERLGLALHKRLGRPGFVVNIMPFKNSYNLDFRFSPGLPDFSRLIDIERENFTPVGQPQDKTNISGPVALILDTNDMDHLRAATGTAYLENLRTFLTKLAASGASDFGVIWQSPANSRGIKRQTAFEAFIRAAVPDIHLNWTHKYAVGLLASSSAIFTLSAYSGLPAAQTYARLIHTLQSGPFDGLGGTRLWSEADSSQLLSPKLTPAQVKTQTQIIKRIKTQYAFDNALKSRARFKSVIQEVIINGVPKL